MELEAELEQERLAIERELEIKRIENIKLQTDFQESQAMYMSSLISGRKF